jgi:AcrR family transcriptional regulator
MHRPVGRLRQRLQAAAAEAMLDSAEQAMIRHGYERATMQQIAAGAGCAAGTFYLYFKNKQVLFEAIAARHAKAMFTEARAEAERASAPMEKIRAGLLAFLRYGQQHRAFFRLFFAAMPQRHHIIRQQLGGSPREDFGQYNRFELGLLRQAQRQGLIRRDLSARILQEFMIDVSFGMVEQFAFSAGRQSVQEQLRILWGLIAGGIGAGRGRDNA